MSSIVFENVFFAEASSGLLAYFSQSNLAGKCIVLFLVAFSLIAWTVMIGKYFELSRLKALNQYLDKHLSGASSVISFKVGKKMGRVGPYASLVTEVINAFCQFNEGDQKSARMARVENGLEREVAKQSMNYESKMVMLGSIVSGAPFLGLLGTVWGVMDAFGAMALQSTASLQNLAPGVSGALLTTVAGLLVAIPSVFGYNYLATRTKQMIIELENFASALSDRVGLELH